MTEVKITNTSSKHAVLVKMMRGHAIAHEQVIEPGKDGAVLVYVGQTVTIEEMERDDDAPEAESLPEAEEVSQPEGEPEKPKKKPATK